MDALKADTTDFARNDDIKGALTTVKHGGVGADTIDQVEKLNEPSGFNPG